MIKEAIRGLFPAECARQPQLVKGLRIIKP